MKEQFDTFYENTLLPELSKIEQQRIANKNKKLKALVILLIAGVALFLLIQEPIIISVPVIIGVVLYFFVYHKDDQSLTINYKENIIRRTVQHFFNDIDYSPYDGMAEEEFNNLELFDETADRYHSEDLFNGIKEKTTYSFSEVHAEYKTERTVTDSDGDTHTETDWHDIFKGIIFAADFNKKFNGTTLIQSNSIKIWDSNDRVKLEDPEFEKLFDVYSNDQQEARYLITPLFMERFIELDRKFGNIMGCFKNSMLYITITYDANNFEMSTWRSIINKEKISFEVKLIYNLINIVDTLDLNTRIWSKE